MNDLRVLKLDYIEDGKSLLSCYLSRVLLVQVGQYYKLFLLRLTVRSMRNTYYPTYLLLKSSHNFF